MKPWKSFLVGSMTTIAFVTLLLVSVFAAFSVKGAGSRSIRSAPFPDPSLTSNSSGPYAPLKEHFCGDAGSCPVA